MTIIRAARGSLASVRISERVSKKVCPEISRSMGRERTVDAELLVRGLGAQVGANHGSPKATCIDFTSISRDRQASATHSEDFSVGSGRLEMEA